MTKYKLIYFAVRGRGEISRLLFHAAGVQFEDKRIDPMDWLSCKHTFPQKALPVLEVDGKRLSQSLTIARHLAREFGLAGATSWEMAVVEQIADTMDDLRAEIAKWIHEKDITRKAEIDNELYETIYPKYIGFLEELLRENESNCGYFVGDNLTLADLSVLETWTLPLETHPDIFDNHPEIAEHRKRIEEDERLANYIKTRPKTPV